MDDRRRMIEEAMGSMGRGRAPQPQGDSVLKEKDACVRQAVADLYLALCETKNTDVAVNMLAEHVAIMVDMINEFKKNR